MIVERTDVVRLVTEACERGDGFACLADEQLHEPTDAERAARSHARGCTLAPEHPECTAAR
jgi:hypothetical protein